jgi:O-antigen ligase
LLHPSPIHAVELAALIVVVAVGLWLAAGVNLYELVSVGMAAEVFSGNWKYVPAPPLDRLILLLCLGMLVLRSASTVSSRRLVFRPIHFLLLAVLAWAAASAFSVGTLTSSYGFYALLDRLGAVPFAMFTLAPLLFWQPERRSFFLGVMVVLGLYLGVVGVAEGVGIHALVVPRYISNPAIGITASRARGPFLASDAMGISMFDTAVFAAIAYGQWRGRLARLCCVAVMGMTPLVILFTLTRSVWIGGVLGTLAVAVCLPQVRRRLPVLVPVAVAAVVATIVLVPGLRAKVSDRTTTVASVWDRYNTNDAALRVIAAHPLTGLGWERFSTVGVDYLREALTYPLTGEGLEVHNVFLSHAAELGLPCACLWVLALATGVGGAVWRKGPPELLPWRLGLLGMFVMFVVVANLGPLSYAFPNLMLWFTAGVVASDRHSVERWSPVAPRTGQVVPELLAL